MGLEQGFSTTPPRGSPVPLTEYLDGGDHRKLCSLGKGESAGSGGRGRGCLEKSWAGGLSCWDSPQRPPIPGGPAGTGPLRL